MNSITFPEKTIIIAENQPEYIPLPAYRHLNPETGGVDTSGQLTFCWQPTWKERLLLALGFPIWHTVLTFNQPLQPQMLSLIKPSMPPHAEMPTPEPPTPPLGEKPLHLISLAECQKGADEYFADPATFVKQGTKYFLIDKGTKTTWGSGNCYGAALVDGIARMELRKKNAEAVHALKKRQ